MIKKLIFAYAILCSVTVTGGKIAYASTAACPQWTSLAYEVGYTPSLWAHMSPKCGRESGGQPGVCNPARCGDSGAYGLMQVLCVRGGPVDWCNKLNFTRAQMLEPRTNLATSLEILCKQGDGAWNIPGQRGNHVYCVDEIRWAGDDELAVPYPHDTAERILPRERSTIYILVKLW